jgi:hypothetical protein
MFHYYELKEEMEKERKRISTDFYTEFGISNSFLAAEVFIWMFSKPKHVQDWKSFRIVKAFNFQR